MGKGKLRINRPRPVSNFGEIFEVLKDIAVMLVEHLLALREMEIDVGQQGEVPMSPFIAAFVACGGMACFIVFFGILLPGRHPRAAAPVALREARSRGQAPITREKQLAG
jgi:hypothetical protein